MTQPGPAWSYSQLKNAETCLKRYYHYNVAKDVVEPETDQLRAGNYLHKAFEWRLKGRALPSDLTTYEPTLTKIIDAPGKLLAEQKLAITGDFEPSRYFGKEVWFRSVADATKINGDKATTFDWKTGKPNEDETQMKLMATMTFIHEPQVQRVQSALVFVNHGEIIPATYVRADMTEIWSEILPRVKVMQDARKNNNYPPKPSGLCKNYCHVTSCPYYGRGSR